MSRIVVIGAGQAGAALAIKLRGLKFDGEIVMIGEEAAPPYQRPPLSKGYLLGEMEKERLWLRSEGFWAENQIDLKLNARASSIDTVERKVSFSGQFLDYDELVLTTGSLPRCLPSASGGDINGVFTIRTLDDIDRIRAEFTPGRRLVVIGGGYIGLEAAAVGRKLGLHVTVIEMAPRILQRVAAAETSSYFRKLHADHGSLIVEEVHVDRILGETQVSAVRLKGGRELPADLVIVGIGIVPSTALAEAAGIVIENGIRTDPKGRTSAPHVWAAGDCASFPMNGVQVRLESVGNAIDQAELVAENIMGAEKDYTPKAWFWSDQYDCKLQIAGLNAGYDRVVTRAGRGEAISVWYYSGEQLIAVDAMNDPRAFMIGKRLIEAKRTADPIIVADKDRDLKELIR